MPALRMYAMRTQQEIAKQNAAAMAAERAQREGYGPDGWPLRGEELLAFARERFPEPWLISFSCGKDSLAAWLWLRERGIQLVPYYLYWVPGLSFVEEALAYYEEFFGTHIIRLPHPYFYRYLDDCMYQLPHQVATINAMQLADFDFIDCDHVAAECAGLVDPLVVIGIRIDDGIDRRRMVQQKGAIGLVRRRFFYPLWDWSLDQTADIIRRHGVRLSREYRIMGRTIAAWDYQYLKPLQQHFPADYERLKQWFPLIDLELFRYEGVGRGIQTQSQSQSR